MGQLFIKAKNAKLKRRENTILRLEEKFYDSVRGASIEDFEKHVKPFTLEGLSLDHQLYLTMGNIQRVTLLLQYGANPNYIHAGQTMLEMTIAKKSMAETSFEIANLLFKHGYKVNTADGKYSYAQYEKHFPVSYYGYPDISKPLLDLLMTKQFPALTFPITKSWLGVAARLKNDMFENLLSYIEIDTLTQGDIKELFELSLIAQSITRTQLLLKKIINSYSTDEQLNTLHNIITSLKNFTKTDDRYEHYQFMTQIIFYISMMPTNTFAAMQGIKTIKAIAIEGNASLVKMNTLRNLQLEYIQLALFLNPRGVMQELNDCKTPLNLNCKMILIDGNEALLSILNYHGIEIIDDITSLGYRYTDSVNNGFESGYIQFFTCHKDKNQKNRDDDYSYIYYYAADPKLSFYNLFRIFQHATDNPLFYHQQKLTINYLVNIINTITKKDLKFHSFGGYFPHSHPFTLKNNLFHLQRMSKNIKSNQIVRRNNFSDAHIFFLSSNSESYNSTQHTQDNDAIKNLGKIRP